MPEATITYKKPETSKILKGLVKYFDFKISVGKDVKNNQLDDIFIKGNKDLVISELGYFYLEKLRCQKT